MSRENESRMQDSSTERRKKYAQIKKRRRRRQRILTFFSLLIVLIVLLGAIFILGTSATSGQTVSVTSIGEMISNGFSQLLHRGEKPTQNNVEDTTVVESEKEEETEVITEAVTANHEEEQVKAVVEKADALAMTYDYDGAIKTVKASEYYGSSSELQAKADEYQASKDACVEITPEEVTHIFYHSLVVDPSKAFVEGEAGYDGWQQWMTTVYEFDHITQSMYDKGYVLVSIHDLVKKSTDENGNVTVEPQSIYLPEGKKAFVLSLDDLSYYHTYDDHGVASKIVLDEEGKPTCEYIEDDGTVVYGDYDVVPRMDTFLEEHPDGCYKGARGIIALTGYNGVLGYRTDGTYSEEYNERSDVYYVDDLQQKWLDAHPDYDFEEEVAAAKEVADAMKAEGWEFASHTWGHKNIGETPYDDLVRDTERWLKYVGAVVGETDTIIFAHGADISVGGYTHEDSKYVYLKEQGFDIYCNVDSTRYSTTVTDEYLHQGRRNLDGYRIYNDYIASDEDAITSDLFNASDVIDPDRPLPVPALSSSEE